MNALRIIIAALAMLATGIVNPNPVQACEPADCPNTPVSPAANPFQSLQRDSGFALTQVGAVNDQVGSLSKQLRSARWNITRLQKRADADSAAVQSQISALRVEIIDLQSRLRTSCASIEDSMAAEKCWEVLDKATGETNLKSLEFLGHLSDNGMGGSIVVGRGDFTPGFRAKVDPPSDTTPAFARTTRVAPASEYSTTPSWLYVGIPLATTAAGALIGYGVGHDSEVDSAGNFDQGNQGERLAIGAGFGLLTGLVIDGIIFAVSGPDEEVVSKRTTTTTVSH